MLGWPWLRVYKVRGYSMLPAFRPADLLVGSGLIRPKPNHIAVLKRGPLSIKRLKRIDKNGIWAEGDNRSASTDSRSYGPVQRSDIEAVIFLRL